MYLVNTLLKCIREYDRVEIFVNYFSKWWEILKNMKNKLYVLDNFWGRRKEKDDKFWQRFHPLVGSENLSSNSIRTPRKPEHGFCRSASVAGNYQYPASSRPSLSEIWKFVLIQTKNLVQGFRPAWRIRPITSTHFRLGSGHALCWSYSGHLGDPG